MLSCLCPSKQTLFSKYDPNGPGGCLTWKTQKNQNTSRHYPLSPIGVKNTKNLKPSVHQKWGGGLFDDLNHQIRYTQFLDEDK